MRGAAAAARSLLLLRRPTLAMPAVRVPARATTRRMASSKLTEDEEKAAKAKYGLHYVEGPDDNDDLTNPNSVLLWAHQRDERDQYLREGFYWTQNWGVDHTREPYELPVKSVETDPNVRITFIDLTGKEHNVNAFIGEDMLTTARRYKIPIDGECEGDWEPLEMYGSGPVCGKCPMLLSDTAWEAVEAPCVVEDNLLARDQPYYYLNAPLGVNTSKIRMGCAISVTPEMEGTKVMLMMGRYTVPEQVEDPQLL